jgi:hypothetical protein
MALADLKNSDFSVTPWMHSMYSANLPVCAGDAQKIYLVNGNFKGVVRCE